MGHPPWEWCNAKMGRPPGSEDEESSAWCALLENREKCGTPSGNGFKGTTAKEFILSGETLATRPRKGEDFIPGSGGVASQVLAFVVPALRKVREGRGTHSLSGGNEGQKPGPAAGLITGYSRR